METTSVTLPDGRVVDDVPRGTTKSVLLDKLKVGGVIDQAQYDEWRGKPPEPVAPAGDPGSLTDFGPLPIAAGLEQGVPMDPSQPGAGPGPMTVPQIGAATADWTSQNMDLPGGMAGALGGAKVGAALGGPPGAVAGAIAGGAAGTFGGELLNDYFANEELDFSKAGKQAAISAGIDAATLGTAKAFKSTARALGLGPAEIGELWAKYSSPKALPVGSQESLEQTQKFLMDEGGSLTAYQTGKASGTRNIAEGIGEIGILSGQGYQRTAQRNSQAIANNLQELIDESASQVTGTNIGETIHGVIRGGVDASQTMYSQNMDEIIQRSGSVPVNPKWIAGTIKKFIKDNKTAYGSQLDDAAMGLAKEWEGTMSKLPSMPLEDLLSFQKKLNQQVGQLGEYGATQNTVASQQLADLSSRLRKTTEALLKDADPAAYDAYRAANQAYGEAMSGLVPKLNANVIARADKGDYESIARALEGKNPDQIRAFMKSIDTAYDQARIAGMDDVPVDKEAAKKAIRGGWLKNIFGEQVEEGFSPKRFQRLADYYEKPANSRAAQEILGDEWPRFKMLINAMAESTNNQTGFVGSLVLRSKEASALQGMAAGGTAAMGALPATAAILGGPVMLAKIVSRPNAVAKLLAGNAKAEAAIKAGQLSAANDIMYKTFESIVGEMPEEDQAEIRNEVR